jgi:hydrophobe/amphiphile efflux-1 (HAE1) family protein
MTLSDLSIRRPVFAWMLFSGLIVFGGISFMRMGVSKLPDVDLPVISVYMHLEGAAPEVMETDVVDVLENSLMSIQGVRAVTSSARYGSASVTLEFELSRNIDSALQDVQAKVQEAVHGLPKDMDPPGIRKTNPEDQPILWLSLDSDTVPLKTLMAYTRDQLKPLFSTVSGVGDVELGGYRDPNLRIWLSDRQLNRYALTVSDVINTIAKEHSEPPAGTLQAGKREYNVRTLGEASTVAEFENLDISSRGGQPNYVPIPLKRVARIEDGTADIRSLTRANGKPAVSLGILKQRGSNEVEVARAVKRRIEEIRKILPAGMNLAINVDGSQFAERSVADMNFTLLLAAILTGLVCWLFLGSWSSTINILLAIPTSVVGTFIVLYFAGFTLNTFTLMGLSLVIGIVVDDAIMMLENIMRHREAGEDKVNAALVGAREITFAATATSLAIVAIFLPVVFMKGVIGRFFFQFGVTITVAVMLSLLEAVTLTPMRCSQFLEVGKRRTRFGQGVEAAMQGARKLYRRMLGWPLEHRWTVVAASLLFFGLSIFSLRYLKQEFMPSEDQGLFMMRLQTTVGSSLPYTDSKFRLVEDYLLRRPEVERVFANVGGGTVSAGRIMVTMRPKGRRGIDAQAGHELSQQELMQVCRRDLKKIPDLKISIQDPSQRSFTVSRGMPVEATIKGPDWDMLAEYSKQIMEELDKTGLVTDLDTDYLVGMPEIQVIPDREKASARGVSIVSIGEVINSMIAGVVVGTYPKSGHRNDIRVKLEEDQRERGDRIRSLFVRNNRGELVNLSDVVRLEERATMQQISRQDRERAIKVFANVAPGQSQQKALEAVQAIAHKVLPGDYHAVLSGGAKSFQESFGDLLLAMILGIFVAYMVLASQFNSYIHPVTILMALPFSVSGAFLALLVTHQSLNIYSMIGMILLLGIVKKNSILLVDFTNKVRERGAASVNEALLEACPIRLRPILMTSIAIIASALPVALAIGPGAESRVPMAVTIIGGVLVSTLLTLFVVPCVYSLFSRLELHRPHSAGIEAEPVPQGASPAHAGAAAGSKDHARRGGRTQRS